MATVAERIELLHKNLAHVEAMGGEKKVEKQHAKGKLTARERLALLFDEGTFVEVNALVKSRCHNFGQEKKDQSFLVLNECSFPYGEFLFFCLFRFSFHIGLFFLILCCCL